MEGCGSVCKMPWLVFAVQNGETVPSYHTAKEVDEFIKIHSV